MTADEEDAEARIATAVRGQSLILEGWFASHADSGTPGPHVHLRTSDNEDAVIRTDQVQEVTERLSQVAGRINRLWESHGQDYTDKVLQHSPDPNDPEVMRLRRIKYLEFTERLSVHLPDVVELLMRAEGTDEALVSIARLLEVEAVEVLEGLAGFDLLTLTRPARAARAKALDALRQG